MKAFVIAIVFAILIPLTVKSQNKLDEALKTYFVQWQKGESVVDISEKLLSFNNEDVLSEVERFAADTSGERRYACYRLMDYLGHHLTNAALRKRIVKQLIYGCNDRDGGITGVNLKSLTTYAVGDFDPEMKYILSEMTKKPQQQHYETLIKLCGWLGVTDLIYNFRQAITEKKGNARDRWAMRLAMARMGEADMINYCLQKAKNVPVNDDVVYDLVPDLIYTHQKPLFDHLLTIIESDEKNCSSSNPDSDAKIICAYRVMEQIAPYIENFPVTVDASGDLKADNYEKALSDVRNWIKQNRESYIIKKESF